jgi:hypothetical protein
VACIVGVLLASALIYCLRHSSHYKLKEKLSGLGGDPNSDASAAYQVKRLFHVCWVHQLNRQIFLTHLWSLPHS